MYIAIHFVCEYVPFLVIVLTQPVACFCQILYVFTIIVCSSYGVEWLTVDQFLYLNDTGKVEDVRYVASDSDALFVFRRLRCCVVV